jgi:hypothetical protein
MAKRFLLSWLAVYLVNSFIGFIIHHVILRSAYKELAAVWQSNAKDKILFFIISSIVGSFFLTLIYTRWQKLSTAAEGTVYGLFIGFWMGSNMSLNTYAVSDLIPFSLSMKWLVLSIIQYAIDGFILGSTYGFLSKKIMVNV